MQSIDDLLDIILKILHIEHIGLRLTLDLTELDQSDLFFLLIQGQAHPQTFTCFQIEGQIDLVIGLAELCSGIAWEFLHEDAGQKLEGILNLGFDEGAVMEVCQVDVLDY